MNLSDLHKQMATRFDLNRHFVHLTREVGCYTFEFNSDFRFSHHVARADVTSEEKIILDEGGEKENSTFRYAVLVPKIRKNPEVIILFHGLNERHWDKYLTWAHHLVTATGKAVILFPLAFHMNRSPELWSSPRTMTKVASIRKAKSEQLENSCFANAALSLRMEYTPEMFPISGIQSYFDVIKLVATIKSDNHPLLSNVSSVNIFAYSIGALLAEVLLIANPASLFSGERAFIFCGGATFDETDGNSKAIMDSKACENLKTYLSNLTTVDSHISIPHHVAHLLPNAWRVFISMIRYENDKEYRREAFDHLEGRLIAVGLKKDKVIPANAIVKTLSPGTAFVEDFPFEYSHEKPFPISKDKNDEAVQNAFETILSRAALHLGENKKNTLQNNLILNHKPHHS